MTFQRIPQFLTISVGVPNIVIAYNELAVIPGSSDGSYVTITNSANEVLTVSGPLVLGSKSGGMDNWGPVTVVSFVSDAQIIVNGDVLLTGASGGGGGGGGGFITANNGLNASSATNVQLGGPLIKDTEISGALYAMGFGSSVTALGNFNVYSKILLNTLYSEFNNSGTGFNDDILASAIQSDGKIIVGGKFTTYNGVNVPDKLIRINVDGTLDTTFNTGGAGFNNEVRTIAIQDDGLVLVGGTFTTYNGVNIQDNLVRLDASGVVDATFNNGGSGFAVGGSVDSIAIQDDGLILVAGTFIVYNGVNVPDNLIRLNEDGTFDSTFNSGGTGFNNGIKQIVIQDDGSVLVAGNFTLFNGGAVSVGLVRLSTLGVLDASFNTAGAGFDLNLFFGTVNAIALQSDGKIIAGGGFTTYNGVNISDHIIRLNTNGSVDGSFVTGTGFDGFAIFSVAIDSDGKVLTGGAFTTYNGTNVPDNLARLNTNGSVDGTFNTGGSGFMGLSVYSIALQANGKILVGGNFTTYNGTDVSDNFTRISSNGTVITSTSVLLNGSGALRYADDYSDQFVDRSIPDVGYVNSIVSSGPFVRLDGTTPLTADWNAGPYNITVASLITGETKTMQLDWYASASVTGYAIMSSITNNRSSVAIVPNGTSDIADLWLFSSSDVDTNYSALVWGYESANEAWGFNSVFSGTNSAKRIYFDATGSENINTSNWVLNTDGSSIIGGATGNADTKLTIKSEGNDETTFNTVWLNGDGALISSLNDEGSFSSKSLHVGSGPNILGPLGASQFFEIVPSAENASYLIARPSDSYYASADFITGTTFSSGWSFQMMPSDTNFYLTDRTNGNNIYIAQNNGDISFGKKVSIGATTATAVLDVSESFSAPSWAANGIGLRWRAAAYTDTTSTGTLPIVAINTFGVATINASSATIFTSAFGNVFEAPVAGTNVTIGTAYALRTNGNLNIVNTTSASVRGILNEQYSSDTSSAKIYNRKSRGTANIPTVIATGDIISNWTSSAYDGSAFVDTSDMRVLSTGTIGTGVIPSQIIFRTTNAAGTLTQAFMIDESQNISIGAIIPTAVFDISKNYSATDWTTNGIGLRWRSATYTSTTGTGTVAATYIHNFAAPTIAASGTVTYTDAYGLNVEAPIAGTNVTLTRAKAARFGATVDIIGNLLVTGTTGISLTGGNINFSGATRTVQTTDSNILQLGTNNTVRAFFYAATSGFTVGSSAIGSTPIFGINPISTSKGAWTTTGVGAVFAATTFTDSTSSGTVAAQYVNVISSPTIAASSVTTYTLSSTMFIANTTAGTNVTETNKAALVVGGNILYQAGAAVRTGTYDAQQFSLVTNNSTRMTIGVSGQYTYTNSSGTTMTFQTYTQSAATTGTTNGLLWTAGAHTGQTASAEITDINFALNRTITWATGTLALQRAFVIGGPTIAFVGTSTVTLASTLDVTQQLPGTNATITSNFAQRWLYDASNYAGFNVDSSGNLIVSNTGSAVTFSKTLNFNGNLQSASTVANGNFFVAFNSSAVNNSTQAELNIAGTGTMYSRVWMRGSTNYTPAANANYGSLVVGQQAVTIAATGTHALFANAIFRPLAITTGAGTVTQTATVYIEGAASAVTGAATNMAVWVAGGLSRFDGNLTLGIAGNKFLIKEGTNGSMGQTALVAGTKAITISGLTTSSRAFVTLVTPSGTASTTTYQAVCTANTLTIQANVAAGTINIVDTSTLNYIIIDPAA